jgi:phosphoribulokinase
MKGVAVDDHLLDTLAAKDLLKGSCHVHFSHFGPEANLFEELETLFRVYGASGTGRARKYLHEEEEAAPYQQKAGTFTPWEDIPSDTDIALLRRVAWSNRH